MGTTSVPNACSGSHQIINGNKPSHSTTISKWSSAISSRGIIGKSFIGKLDSNGPTDNHLRIDTGRDTIIYAPCTTDFSIPVEISYFFHGNTGFNTDMATRLAPQTKSMSEQGRNFVLVFPELPFSAGTNGHVRGWSSRNPGAHSRVWDGTDSDLVELHNEVRSLLTSHFLSPGQTLQVNLVSMVGHSGGGSPLKRAADRPSVSNNAFSQIGVKKITFSDADYGWQGAGSSSKFVYDNYVKHNSGVQLNLLVQDVSQSGAHSPTRNSISFVKNIGGSQVSSWTSSSTPGADPDKVYEINIGSNQVNYVPLSTSHAGIGLISYAWTAANNPGGGITNSASRGTSQTSSNPVSSNIQAHMSCGSTTKCEELHKVWSKIGPIVGKSQFWKPNSKLNGQWISNFNQLGLQPPQPSPSPTPSKIHEHSGLLLSGSLL